MTPAQKAAEEIIEFLGISHPHLRPRTKEKLVEIIARHCGDGEDKERMDWAFSHPHSFIRIFNNWIPDESQPTYRAAIDAERKDQPK